MRSLLRFRFRSALCLVLLAAFATGAASAGSAKAASAVSSNWAGYAVTGTTFSRVSGEWVQPAASCTSRTAQSTASAFWVGLGGDTSSSNALEQAGTEADCEANGTIRYMAWYELVPKASVAVGLKVSAGDRISASVDVSETTVTVKLANLTTGETFERMLRMSSPDRSSAEWIAEAPSIVTPGGTTVLPLTDFGTVRFRQAVVTSASGHTGSISDPAWSATRIRLVAAAQPGLPGPFAADQTATAEAVTATLTARGSAFAVRYRTGDAGGRTPPI